MKKWCAILLLFSILFASGCSSTIQRLTLAESIQTTWNTLGEAYCKNKDKVIIVPDGTNQPSVTFQVTTQGKVDVGWTGGVTLTGEGLLSEGTGVTVKFDLSKYDCTKKVEKLEVEKLEKEKIKEKLKLLLEEGKFPELYVK